MFHYINPEAVCFTCNDWLTRVFAPSQVQSFPGENYATTAVRLALELDIQLENGHFLDKFELYEGCLGSNLRDNLSSWLSHDVCQALMGALHRWAVKHGFPKGTSSTVNPITDSALWYWVDGRVDWNSLAEHFNTWVHDPDEIERRLACRGRLAAFRRSRSSIKLFTSGKTVKASTATPSAAKTPMEASV